MEFWQINVRVAILVLIVLGCQSWTAAQQNGKDETTQITADDFPRTRDLTGDSNIANGKTVFIFKGEKKPTFQLKRTTPRIKYIPAKPATAKTTAGNLSFNLPIDNKSAMGWKKLGVTIWRLEPEIKGKAADGEVARLLVQDGGTSKEYTPQRVAADTEFKLGDKLRLSFESPGAGYLYVIDREIYADGKVGEPYLIFPTLSARGGDNRVQPGAVIDIPGQSDSVPYFTLKSNNSNWRGELLTVIVSPMSLAGIGLPDKPSPISAAMVAALEDKYLKPADEYDQKGSAGQSYTKAEKEAGGIGTRQLTQDDPFPQTVYRVKTRAKEPMLINLNLSLK